MGDGVHQRLVDEGYVENFSGVSLEVVVPSAPCAQGIV